MKNLSLSLLGLVLIGIPICLSENTDKQCFSQPTYPCCKGNKVVYVDESGYWGVEDGEWCGIEKDSSNSCFSIPLGYSCCEQCDILFTDESGKWGVENGKWCGIKDSCTSDVVQNNQDFDFIFLKMENNKKNMLYSPLSIKYALQMLLEGAEGNTYDEIRKVVDFEELTKYETIDENLSLANGLFIRDKYYSYVKTPYINTLKNKYEAEIIKDEFKDAQNVNQWIEDKTLGIIKNMLKDEIVQDPYSGMLLINALAIDMEWVSSFISNDTYGKTFQIDNNRNMTATMMSQKILESNASYYIDDDITVLTMDLKKYGDTQFEFMAIMPNNNDLSGYVENVTKEQINQIDEKLILASDVNDGIKVYIPKFKFSYDLKLKKDLVDLGIKYAFDKVSADFSKIADPKELQQNIYVKDALHKADIEFTEKGVKAAAVTAISMGGFGGIPPPTYPVIVEIDKSFMFIIRDKNTKDIWFTGTVYEPNKWEEDKKDYPNSFAFINF